MSHFAGTFCPECHYALRGLRAGQPCPECGHRAADEALHPHAAWSRSVFFGLILLLGVTLLSIGSVLVQPFVEKGGTAAALNLPGPKLWAMPLLLRPVGRSPEFAGVLGTLAAMLSLVAVWLITAPAGIARVQRYGAMRLFARWGCVTAFGMAFGVMLAIQGIYGSEMPALRVLLVALVELPGTVLLYLYLRRLAQHVPGQARRQTFDRLAMAAPLVVLLGLGALMGQWWLEWDRNEMSARFITAGSAAYATAALLTALVAVSAVTSLAGAYFRMAFPSARRWLEGMQHLLHRSRSAREGIDSSRRRSIALAAGAGLLVLTAVLAFDRLTWLPAPAAPGGNLPFVNFPGPKVWATAVIMESGVRSNWGPIMSQSTLLAMNLAAVWLLTSRAGGGDDPLRRWARWLPVWSIGMGFGAVAAMRSGTVFGMNFNGGERNEFFVIVSLACEVPATVLLYAAMARTAGELGWPELRRQFECLAVAIAGLVVLSCASLWIFRGVGSRLAPEMVLIGAGFGAASLAAGMWAASAVIKLGVRAMCPSDVADTETAIGAQKEPPREAGRLVNDLDDEALAALTG